MFHIYKKIVYSSLLSYFSYIKKGFIIILNNNSKSVQVRSGVILKINFIICLIKKKTTFFINLFQIKLKIYEKKILFQGLLNLKDLVIQLTQ